jgi:hypothetical protein
MAFMDQFKTVLPKEYFNGYKLKPGYIRTGAPIEGLALEYSDPGRKPLTGYRQGQKTTFVGGTNPFYIYKDPAKVAEERTLALFQQQAAEAEAYRTETMKIAEQAKSERTAAEKMMEDYRNMLIQEADAKRAAQEQADVALRTSTANLAMSGRAPNLQIASASQTPQTAGTQPFKRRRLMMDSASPLSSSLNIGLSNSLNI